MTDDIVARLRDGKGDDIVLFEMMDEAAKEIERLRKTLQMIVIDYRTQIAGLKMRCTCKGNTDGV